MVVFLFHGVVANVFLLCYNRTPQEGGDVMAISLKVYDLWLQDYLASDMSEEKKQDLINKIERFQEKRIQNALAILMGYLYNHDYASLKRDLLKIIILDTEKEPEPEERVELLQVLWWCITVFFHGDYSLIIDECERVISSWGQTGDYDHMELPFM